MKEPLEEESEISVVEVDQVPWRGVRRNDRDESEGSCERLGSSKGKGMQSERKNAETRQSVQ